MLICYVLISTAAGGHSGENLVVELNFPFQKYFRQKADQLNFYFLGFGQKIVKNFFWKSQNQYVMEILPRSWKVKTI
jgi:hypothetical protein